MLEVLRSSCSVGIAAGLREQHAQPSTTSIASTISTRSTSWTLLYALGLLFLSLLTDG